MAEYFFRVDGTAATLGAAIGPATSAVNCGDKALLEASTFTAGDIVNIVTNGGSFTNVTLSGDKISGTSGTPIIIRGDSVYNTTSASEHILQLAGNVTDIEHITLEDFWAECTHVAANTTASVQFFGDVGIASNSSVTLSGCKSRNLGGDGFSQLSGGAGHINYVDCDAVDCGSGRATTESNQGFTAHNSGHSATLTTTNVTGCNEAITFVGAATADWISGTISGSLGKCVKVDSGGSVTLQSGVTLNCDIATSRLLDIGDVTASINFNGTTVNITNHESTDSFARGVFTVVGGAWSVNAANATIQAITAGTLEVSGITLDAINWSSLFRTDGNANCTVNFKRNSVDFSSAISSQPLIRMLGSSTFEVDANLFTEITSASDVIDVTAGATTTNMHIRHNTVYNAVSGGQFLDDDSGVNLSSNIFYNIADVDRGAVGATANYNCYFNSENLGGANSITTDPQFANPGSDFTLQSGSPCIATGDPAVTVATDHAGNSYSSPPSMGAFEFIASGGGIVSSVVQPVVRSVVRSVVG